MAEATVELAPAKKKFNGQDYILTKINFTEEDAHEDEAYHKKRGRKVKTVEEPGYWFLYTKIGP